MKKLTTILLFIILLTATICYSKNLTQEQPEEIKLAILTLSATKKNQNKFDRLGLQNVINWMNRDIGQRTRAEGFITSFIQNMKEYSSTRGTLFIIDVVYYSSSHEKRKARLFSLELNYKLLDIRGALLAEWTDGADSKRGGTYCARALNKRALKKITSVLKH